MSARLRTLFALLLILPLALTCILQTTATAQETSNLERRRQLLEQQAEKLELALQKTADADNPEAKKVQGNLRNQLEAIHLKLDELAILAVVENEIAEVEETIARKKRSEQPSRRAEEDDERDQDELKARYQRAEAEIMELYKNGKITRQQARERFEGLQESGNRDDRRRRDDDDDDDEDRDDRRRRDDDDDDDEDRDDRRRRDDDDDDDEDRDDRRRRDDDDDDDEDREDRRRRDDDDDDDDDDEDWDEDREDRELKARYQRAEDQIIELHKTGKITRQQARERLEGLEQRFWAEEKERDRHEDQDRRRREDDRRDEEPRRRGEQPSRETNRQSSQQDIARQIEGLRRQMARFHDEGNEEAANRVGRRIEAVRGHGERSGNREKQPEHDRHDRQPDRQQHLESAVKHLQAAGFSAEVVEHLIDQAHRLQNRPGDRHEAEGRRGAEEHERHQRNRENEGGEDFHDRAHHEMASQLEALRREVNELRQLVERIRNRR